MSLVDFVPFSLHPKLAEDGIVLGDLNVCRVLLMNNSLFPWLILVPMREGLREWFDLSPADYPLVMEEIRDTASRFSEFTAAHKMNVAALGNMVSQLHIHIIARYTTDPAWPQPVWCYGGTPLPYSAEALASYSGKIRDLLLPA